MADSYILNIKPTISASDGRKLESDLNGRFARVAKKFGGALRTVGSKLRGIIAGGAVAGIGAMMTNPIDSLNSTLDETLRRYDDISSRAKQLGVSSGQLFQATAIAKSAGIQEEDFRAMLTAYAVKVGEAKAGQDQMLKEFVNEDMLTGFFKMVRSLRELSPEQRAYFGAKILGEDDVAKLAELINTDVQERHRQLFGKTTAEQTTRAIEKLAGTEGKQSIMRGRLDVENLLAKSQNITNETIKMQSELERKKQEAENINLSNYEMFARMQQATEESKIILADMQAKIAPLLEKSVGILERLYNWLINSKLGKWAGGVFK